MMSCIAGGSLSTMVLGPIWRAEGWGGVTLACSLSLVFSLVLALRRALKPAGEILIGVSEKGEIK